VMRVMTHFLLWNFGLAAATTWCAAAECECLVRYAAGKKRLVEIGCGYGLNTSRLRSVMAPDGILFALDPYLPGRLGFSASRRVALHEVSKISNGSVQWMRSTDVQAARDFVTAGEGPVDFVYSDAVNTYDGLRDTWEAWSPLVGPGGIY